MDASAVLAWLLADERWGRAIAERLRGARLHAPELLDLEVVSGLRRHLAAGHLDADAARATVDAYGRLAVERMPHHALLPRVWQLRDNLTVYDAAYVALAESLQAPLLTTDARLAGAPGIRCAIELLA